MSATPSPADPFKSGSILWVKCGQLFWPGQVLAESEMSKELQDSIAEEKRKPVGIVKFFNEEGYEFLYDHKNVFPYNCDRKEEFIKKGIVKSRTKSKEGATGGWFAKFPNDIVLCEEITNGDPKLLEKDPYVERNDTPNYKDVFGSPDEKSKKSPKKDVASTPKGGAGAGGRKRKLGSDSPATVQKKEPPNKRPIVHPRFQGQVSDHQVKILPQPSTPYHLDLIKSQDAQAEKNLGSSGLMGSGGGANPAAGKYTCQTCGFSASRLNVIILHNKSHTDPSSSRAPSNVPSSTTPKRSNLSSARSTSGASAPPKTSQATPVRTKKSAEPPAKKGRMSAKTEQTKSPAETKATPTRAKRTPTVKAPAKTSSPVKEERKPRMTKKRKELIAQEEQRKNDERKKILGDWSEEEEGEEEEKKKIKEVLEPFVDSSEEEDEREDWMMEDNVLGNVYEGDDVNQEDSKEEGEKKDKAKSLPDVTTKAKAQQHNGEEEKKKKKQDQDLCLDIGKVLEETSVPSLPTADVADLVGGRKSTRLRKSVSFAVTKPKEIVQKSIALVQAESNLVVPPMVDDDFDEFVNDYPIPTAPPKVYTPRRILKKSQLEEPKKAAPTPAKEEEKKTDAFDFVEEEEKVEKIVKKPPTPAKSVTLSFAADWDDEEEEDSSTVVAVTQKAVVVTSAGPSVVTTTLGSAVEEPQSGSNGLTLATTELDTQVSFTVKTPVVSAVPAEPPEHHQQQHQHQHQQQEYVVDESQQEEQQQMYVEGGVAGEEDTYLILVDDGSGTVGQLDSQTLYIDSSQLAGGGGEDLSNMVLMANQDAAAYSNAPQESFSSAVIAEEDLMNSQDGVTFGDAVEGTSQVSTTSTQIHDIQSDVGQVMDADAAHAPEQCVEAEVSAASGQEELGQQQDLALDCPTYFSAAEEEMPQTASEFPVQPELALPEPVSEHSQEFQQSLPELSTKTQPGQEQHELELHQENMEVNGTSQEEISPSPYEQQALNAEAQGQGPVLTLE